MTFKNHTLEEHTNLIASCLPNDKLWLAKNITETNLRKFLKSNADALVNIESKIVEYINEMSPETTELFLSEWEGALKIPDDCFPLADTVAQRRKYILAKLNSLSAVTKEDFENIAEILGFAPVSIAAGIDFWDTFPLVFPIMMFKNETDARFCMVVTLEKSFQPNIFPFTFPILFTEGEQTNILECIFKKLVPAPVKIIFRYI